MTIKNVLIKMSQEEYQGLQLAKSNLSWKEILIRGLKMDSNKIISEHQKMTVWLYEQLKPKNGITEVGAKIAFDLTGGLKCVHRRGLTYSCRFSEPQLEEPIEYVNGTFRRLIRRPDIIVRLTIHLYDGKEVLGIACLDCIFEVKPELDTYNNLQKAISQLKEACSYYQPKDSKSSRIENLSILERSTCLVVCTNTTKYDDLLATQGIIAIHPKDYEKGEIRL